MFPARVTIRVLRNSGGKHLSYSAPKKGGGDEEDRPAIGVGVLALLLAGGVVLAQQATRPTSERSRAGEIIPECYRVVRAVKSGTQSKSGRCLAGERRRVLKGEGFWDLDTTPVLSGYFVHPSAWKEALRSAGRGPGRVETKFGDTVSTSRGSSQPEPPNRRGRRA